MSYLSFHLLTFIKSVKAPFTFKKGPEKQKPFPFDNQAGALVLLYDFVYLVPVWSLLHPLRSFCSISGENTIIQVSATDIFYVLVEGGKEQCNEFGLFSISSSREYAISRTETGAFIWARRMPGYYIHGDSSRYPAPLRKRPRFCALQFLVSFL